MTTLAIDRALLSRYPQLHVGVARFTLPETTPANAAAVADERLKAAEAALQAAGASPAPAEDDAWADAYRWFGAKPKKQRHSAAALARRVLGGGDLPRILPLVDLYNAASLASGLPIGADDLAHVQGNIELGFASGDEVWEPAGGGPPASPRAGEVIYRDAGGVLCRRWNWREGARTALRAESRDILLYVESLLDGARVRRTLAALAETVTAVFGVPVQQAVLTAADGALDIESWALSVSALEQPERVPVKRAPPENAPRKERGQKNRGPAAGRAQRKKGPRGFWADQMAQEIIQRVESNPRLSKLVADQGMLVYDEKTPSGSIHIGSGRGWILHDVMARALREKGADARFVLSSDDMDPYDKPSAGLPRADWDQHLGKPFRHIPSPEPGYESFGDYYFRQCTNLFDQFAIEAGLESTGALYESGAFDPAIQRALDHTEQIQAIYTDLYGDTPASHRLPFAPLCEKCGRIGTTRAIAWDGARGMLRYECRSDIMAYKDPVTKEKTFIQGCGHQGERSPFQGGGKFPWKIEWAAKWVTKGVIAEWAGKDHFSAGGSRTAACRFSVDIFDFPPPYPSRGYKTGPGYEFLNVGGRKMSTSKGAGVGFAEVAEVLSPRMLRYLLIRSRPNQVIDFDPNRDSDILLLYTNHDRTESAAIAGNEKLDAAALQREQRIYHYTWPEKPLGDGTPLPHRVPFRITALVAQSVATVDEAIDKLREMEHVPAEGDFPEVAERVQESLSWLSHYAPESALRIELNEALPADLELSDEDRAVFGDIYDALLTRPSDAVLTGAIFTAIKSRGMRSKAFFAKAYHALLGQPQGPALSPFLLSMGERVHPLLRAAAGREG